MYVLVPSLAVSGILYGVGYYEMVVLEPFEHEQQLPQPELPAYMTPIEPQVGKFDAIPYIPISIASVIGFSSLSVYLVIIWSRKWNEKFRH